MSIHEKNMVPGPGDYSPRTNTLRSAAEASPRPHGSFSKAERSNLAKNAGTPGPGEYKLPAKFAEV